VGHMPQAPDWSVDYLRGLIDRRLRILLPDPQTPPQRLHQAMAYSLLAPGKRLRPILTLLTSFNFGCDDLRALDCACAVEMVHTASLIMDDMPCMDNSDLRRGQPTSHRQFGEDIAMLTSVALLNHSYAVIAAADAVPPASRLALVATLSRSVGSDGLIGGQLLDLRERCDTMNERQLERLNQLKTAALFVASVEAGAHAAGIADERLEMVRSFALELGLAFQIADDIIDDPSYAGRTGKDTGKDQGKPTLVSKLGAKDARHMLDRHLDAARASLDRLGGRTGHLASFVEASFGQFNA